MKRIFLIDGMGILFRAYYAFIGKPLINSKGENTSGIFGTLRILLQLIREYQPDSIAIAFDVSRKTLHRTEIYPEYKAHREEAPEDLKAQIPRLYELLDLMSIPIFRKEGYEADDIIGTLAEHYKTDHEIYIVSGDKDLMQLVGGNVRMMRVKSGISQNQMLDNIGVQNEMGIPPQKIADYLALVGDKSDNIPGVKGIGDKGAVSLLSKYESVEDIYNHLDEITGATGKKLTEQKDSALLSKKLSLISRDMNITEDITPKPYRAEQLANEALIKKLDQYELKSIIAEIKKMIEKKAPEPSGEDTLLDPVEIEDEYLDGELELFNGPAVEALNGDYKLINTPEGLKEVIAEVRSAGFMSVDTETTARHPAYADIVGISVSCAEKTGYYIPVAGDQAMDKSEALKILRPVLEDASITKIGQNIKYDAEMFIGEGIAFDGIGFDTMVAAYLINPAQTHLNLDDLAEDYLRYKTIHYSDIVDKKGSILDVPADKLRDYASEDADIALRLKNKLEPYIAKNKLERVFFDIELPLIPVLAEMELNGVKLDVDGLSRLSEELEHNIAALEKEIYEIAGYEFNVNSPPQLSKILFEDLGLEVVKKTPTGKASTDEEVLKILSDKHPLPYKIVEFRTYSKLKSTYVDALPKLINPKTGRVHSSFNQTIAATGRLSSSDPNLQNIPIRDKIGQDIGKRIREAFIPAEGYKILSVDYSQIELRFLAHFSENETMSSAFGRGVDIHSHTASQIFNIPENEVTSEQRWRAKSVNFGIIYGLQAYGLSRQLGISVQDAKSFIDSYYSSFPEVKSFMEKTLHDVYETGEVRTLFGRLRRFPSLKAKKGKQSQFLNQAERMAINTRIQGTVADMMKLAMIAVHRLIHKDFPEVKMLIQIHDELVFEVPEGQVESFRKVLIETMEHPQDWVEIRVPLTVDAGVGDNWAEAH